MNIVDIILKKRNGQVLSPEEIKFFVEGVHNGDIKDYQTSAFLMAVYFRGMNKEELAYLTKQMADSGDKLSFPEIDQPIVDKHSSGGVGDKTSLIIAPIVAACGLPIAKLSGRGLGFTGGTIDKLESIPGFRTELSEKEFIDCVSKDGIALIGQSADIAPVDKKLYALRDVTGTVDSMPLIAASIMSKKLADGSDAIVLDVKYGSGAFMKTPEDAIELAKIMVDIGEDNGKKTIALVTNMDQPLGSAVGNALEVAEAIEVLKGRGPADLILECKELSVAMLMAGGKASSKEEAEEMVKKAIDSGQALEKFRRMVINQGGDEAIVDKPELLGQAQICLQVQAPEEGYIQAINAEEIGKASLELGAGRRTKEDTIDMTVGLKILKKVGDRINKGDIIFEIYANDRDRSKRAKDIALAAYKLNKEPVEKISSPVYARVYKDRLEKGGDNE